VSSIYVVRALQTKAPEAQHQLDLRGYVLFTLRGRSSATTTRVSSAGLRSIEWRYSTNLGCVVGTLTARNKIADALVVFIGHNVSQATSDLQQGCWRKSFRRQGSLRVPVPSWPWPRHCRQSDSKTFCFSEEPAEPASFYNTKGRALLAFIKL